MPKLVMFAPGESTVVTSEMSVTRSVVAASGYDVLAGGLRALGASVSLAEHVTEATVVRGEALLATRRGAGEVFDLLGPMSPVLARTVLLDALPDAARELDGWGLLGGVPADALWAWRRGGAGGVDLLYGRCDLISELGPSRRMLASRGFCVLESGEPELLPQTILAYLELALPDSSTQDRGC